ncbi:hypothetical protein ACQPW1_10230 [Nocardia sp. CA-128927]|uniref:hypothetical protein n=1 Tax=Nocardia sp. CA-128927 TaxID=3239975 RepID=UPI003D97BECF
MIIEYDAIDWVAEAKGRGRPRVRKSGEVWGPGPKDGTVWVLDPERQGLGARVVNLSTLREVESKPSSRKRQKPSQVSSLNEPTQFELFQFA